MARTDRSASIDTSDLREFRKELKALDSTLETDFGKIADKKVAEFVADKTQETLRGLPGAAPKIAPAVKAAATAKEALIRVNSIRATGNTPLPPHGVIFGGGGRPRTRQFRPHRGSGADAGYALYPDIRSNTSKILDIYGDFVENTARPAFPD